VSAATRHDFEAGNEHMVDIHPTSAFAQERYDHVVDALTTAGFTPYELRGMLAVALDRLRTQAVQDA
jgi:hypothetical protein